METPEFLVWAIEHTCPIRGLQNGSNPERTERQLRAARAVSDARREGRVFEGLCVDPPDGFRIDDALTVYGGLAAVESACRGCPANALDTKNLPVLAGCFGILPLPHELAQFHASIDRAAASINSGRQRRTNPTWYDLWVRSPIAGPRLFDLSIVLRTASKDGFCCEGATDDFVAALDVALANQCRVHVQLFPRGRVEGNRWHLAQHCPRCKAEWPDRMSNTCRVCDHIGQPANDQKRMARGKRPYFLLERLLGEQPAAEFLVRYSAFRARQQSPDQAESQPPPGRPDNPPAG